MIPSVLEYTRASSIDEAIAAVAAGATPLSGGQSLLPMMRLRLAAPGEARPSFIIGMSDMPPASGRAPAATAASASSIDAALVYSIGDRITPWPPE